MNNKIFVSILYSAIFFLTFGLLFSVSSRNRREPVTPVISSSRPVVAITFDDGPNSTFTPQILDVLYKNDVAATFFICGKNISTNEKLLNEIVNSGHELGNHTFTHPDLTTLTHQEILNEFKDTQSKLSELLPDYNLDYIRPPYGRYNEDVLNIFGSKMTLWEIDSGDWEDNTHETITDNVVNTVKDGDIIVFHDDNEDTVIAIEEIIVILKEKGFKFATVSQLNEMKAD